MAEAKSSGIGFPGLRKATGAERETADGPFADRAASPVSAMIERGRGRGYVTRDELDRALPPDEAGAGRIEDTMTVLSELGIAVAEGDEPQAGVGRQSDGTPSGVDAKTGGHDPGRTDDPMTMYMRDMGSIVLLTREGEVALAKRIEAGRLAVLHGQCESLRGCEGAHLRGGGDEDWAYLFVLIEFQSAADHLMALRVSTYVDVLYRGLWASRHLGASELLPPVLPVVLYNGASPWTAAASFEELVAPQGRPSGSAGPVPVYACWRSRKSARIR